VPVVLLATLLVLYLRAPDAFQHPNFWAEDGVVFFRQWQEMGLASIFEPYNGYLHLAPRLVAALAGALPLEQTVMVYFLASLAGACWTGLTIHISTAPRPLWCPLFLLPFLALSATEVLASPTNLQWVLATGLIILLLNPARLAGAALVNALVFVVVAGLSGPFGMFALAAVLGALVLARVPVTARHVLVLATLAAVSAVQAVFVVDSYAPSGGSVTVEKAYEAFFAILRKSTGGSVETILIAITALAGAAVGRDRFLRAGCLLFGVLLTLAIAVRFAADAEVFPNGVSERYRYVPSVMWLTILVSLLADTSYRSLRAMAAVCLVLYAAALVDGQFVRVPRPPIDDWRTAVQAAEQNPVHYRFPPDWRVIVYAR